MTRLESLQVDRKDCDEECMDEEPMGDKDDNGEDAKLSDGATCEDSDNAEDGVASHHLECIGGPCNAHAFADAFLDWQCDRSRNDFIDLKRAKRNSNGIRMQRTSRNMFSAPMNTTVIGRKPLGKSESWPRILEIGVPWDHCHPKTPNGTDADTTNSAGNDLNKTSKGETES
jgi:hypothetical protein